MLFYLFIYNFFFQKFWGGGWKVFRGTGGRLLFFNSRLKGEGPKIDYQLAT